MTHTSCISHPTNERLVQVHEWQLAFCDKNQCAAFLLANFEHWHNWKLRTDAYNKKMNDIAEQHGEPRRLSEDVWLFKSLQGLSDSILNLFGVKTINEALKLLERKGAISIGSNPSKYHHYDKRKYFRFYPEVCNDWIKNQYLGEQNADLTKEKAPAVKMPNALVNSADTQMIKANSDAEIAQPIENIETVKISDAFGIFTDTQGKNAVTINELNINKNIKTNSLTASEGELIEPTALKAESEEAKPIVDALIAKGMKPKRFYPDSIALIMTLVQSGATRDMFEEAYDKAVHHTGDGDFGIPYLAKILGDRLAGLRKKASPSYPKKPPPLQENEPCVYEHDFKNGLDWMGDLI